MLNGGGAGALRRGSGFWLRPLGRVRVCVRGSRRHDVATGLLYTWRRKCRQELPQPAFAEAVLADAPLASSAADLPAIIVELGGRGPVSISASAPPALAAAVLTALR